MTGPWEKYAQQPAQDGPWSKYAQPESVPRIELSGMAQPETTLMEDVKQGAGDLLAGAVRGAGSIGATILAPIDVASDLMAGKGLTLESNRQRRQAMDDGLRSLGANPDSVLYKTGKIGTEIAGTLGAGGAVANVARRVVPTAAQATPLVSNLIRAVETSGAQGGNLLSRSAGSAITGATSAGMANPEEIGVGALVGGAAPSVLQAAGKVGSGIGNMLRGGTTDAQRLAAARTAQQAGYVIPPSDIQQQGAITEMLGGLSGKIKTAQEASARNASVTTKMAKESLGIADDVPLTRETLQGVRRSAGQAYEAVRSAGTVQATPEYLAAIDNIAKETQGAARSFPGLKNDEVGSVMETLKQPQFDSGDAIDAIRALRDKADSAFAKKESGAARAYKAASQALEDALDKHLQSLGDAEALNAFRSARQTIAKSYTIEKALNGQTGQVSAQVLARELKKGKPLTGGLRTAAESAEAFPKALQDLKEAPKAISPLDWAVSAMSGTATGNPLMLATLGARPMVRNALLSAPVQSYAARDIGPSALTRALTPQNQLLVRRALPVLAADQ